MSSQLRATERNPRCGGALRYHWTDNNFLHLRKSRVREVQCRHFELKVKFNAHTASLKVRGHV